MRKYFVIFFILSLTSISISQVVYNTQIDSVKNLVSIANLNKFDRELSGDTITIVNGSPVLIYSRYYLSPSNIIASNYIYEKFRSFGLQTRYQVNNSTNINVIARITGSKYPNKKIVIGAHYDNNLTNIPVPLDTVHGADDNASGVSAVIEAARLLSNFNCLYTVEFVAFDEEELGSLGSEAYADSAYFKGDTIIAVFNYDMIGFDSNNDGKYDLYCNDNSIPVLNIFKDAISKYQIQFTFGSRLTSSASDHIRFWNRGYKAITGIEDHNNFNPYYHTINDTWNKFNLTYFYNFSKAAIISLLSVVSENFIMFSHTPLSSNLDTSARNVLCEIKFSKIASGNNSPRLYYKVGNGPFSYINANNINGDNYTFKIPGQPHGTKVSYYFAAQDSSGNNIATYPMGGSGINPPGTTPPTELLYYNVQTLASFVSTTVPKPIVELQQTTDTIYIQQTGNVENVKVNLSINHPNVGELLIVLFHFPYSSVLAQYNGVGGQNFTNTTFDDSAALSISQGTPPFTGSFRPMTPLSTFINQQLQGNWVLEIYDIATGNSGILLNWSLIIRYSPQVGIRQEITEIPDEFTLEQNYPNPFNSTTNINYSLPNTTYVTLIVYDITGRNVATLVNEYQQRGNYFVRFNTVNLSSGLYFYKIIANGNFITKKMVLIR